MAARAGRLPFSLDPPIAEAKRRARQRRVLVLLVAVAAIVTGAALAVELSGQEQTRRGWWRSGK